MRCGTTAPERRSWSLLTSIGDEMRYDRT